MGIFITQCLILALFITLLDILFTVANQRYQKAAMNELALKSLDVPSERRKRIGSFIPFPSLEETKDVIRNHAPFRRRGLAYIELTLLGIWAVLLGAEYLNFNLGAIPAGHEFGSAIQSNHFWLQLEKCGMCALWNGSSRGGYPALAEVYGSFFHPIVAVTTILLGVVNGAKITFIISLWLAGVAQWWISHELKLSWLPRMWSAFIAISGGHLSGRMQMGVLGLVLSTAMASLLFAAILHLENRQTNRAAVLLGMIAALTIISGQGYIQAGLLSILPVILIIFFLGKDRIEIIRHSKQYLIVAVIAFMLAAPFLFPLIHFGPNIAKDNDTSFSAAQPLQYLVLNLVINDTEFFRSEILGKLPFPYLFTLYIGWIPVLFAIFGISSAKLKEWRMIAFLTAGAVLSFIIASGIVYKPIATVLPAISGVRQPSIIAGLAIPFILGLSAFGLEFLLGLLWSKNQAFHMNNSKAGIALSFSIHWIVLVPLLVLSVKSTFNFSRIWLILKHRDQVLYSMINALKTDSSQWVNPPFGEHIYVEPAIEMGLKLSPGIIPWNWKDREIPAPKIQELWEGVPPGNIIKTGEVNGASVYEDLDEEYAYISSDESVVKCSAYSSGGLITTTCRTDISGILTIKENRWSGWSVWVDGVETDLEPGGNWLSVKALEGEHNYTFKYLPADVLLGSLIFFVGIFACFTIWSSPDESIENKRLYE